MGAVDAPADLQSPDAADPGPQPALTPLEAAYEVYRKNLAAGGPALSLSDIYDVLQAQKAPPGVTLGPVSVVGVNAADAAAANETPGDRMADRFRANVAAGANAPIDPALDLGEIAAANARGARVPGIVQRLQQESRGSKPDLLARAFLGELPGAVGLAKTSDAAENADLAGYTAAGGKIDPATENEYAAAATAGSLAHGMLATLAVPEVKVFDWLAEKIGPTTASALLEKYGPDQLLPAVKRFLNHAVSNAAFGGVTGAGGTLAEGGTAREALAAGAHQAGIMTLLAAVPGFLEGVRDVREATAARGAGIQSKGRFSAAWDAATRLQDPLDEFLAQRAAEQQPASPAAPTGAPGAPTEPLAAPSAPPAPPEAPAPPALDLPPLEEPHAGVPEADLTPDQLREQRDAARRLAATSLVSGLPNERAWNVAWPRAEATPGAKLGIIDFSNWKAYNDKNGWVEGDAQLRRWGQQLDQVASRYTIPGPDGQPIRAIQVFHPHGDEFGFTVDPRADPAVAQHFLVTAHQEIQPIQVGRFTVHFRGGIGDTYKAAQDAFDAAKKGETGATYRGSTEEANAKPPAPQVGPVTADDPEAVAASVQEGHVPPPGAVVRYPTRLINTDPERFQFRTGTDAEGQTGAFKGVRWNDSYPSPLTLWRDPADGKVYVVNGHQRLGIARASGVEDVPVRFSDAPDAQGARVDGTLINLAEAGNPTKATDVAKFFRDTGTGPEGLAARDIRPNAAIVKKGLALRDLTPELFNDVVTGRLPEDTGAIIGEMLKEPELQREAVRAIGEKRLTPNEIREVARQVRDAPTTETSQETLFGTETDTKSLYAERAQLASDFKRRLGSDKRLFGTVADEGRAGRLEAAGAGDINRETAAEAAYRASRASEIFDRLYTRRGPISDILNQGARRLADGEKLSQVAKDLYEPLHEAVRAELEREMPAAAGVSESVAMGGRPMRGPSLQDRADAAGIRVRAEGVNERPRMTSSGVNTRLVPDERVIRAYHETRALLDSPATAEAGPGVAADIAQDHAAYAAELRDRGLAPGAPPPNAPEEVPANDRAIRRNSGPDASSRPWRVGDRTFATAQEAYTHAGYPDALRATEPEGTDDVQASTALHEPAAEARTRVPRPEGPPPEPPEEKPPEPPPVAPHIVVKYLDKVKDDFLRTFAPGSRSPEAAAAQMVLRAGLGEMAQRNDAVQYALHTTARMFDRMSEEERFDFIDRMEEGKAQATPELDAVAAHLRTVLDAARDQVRALGTGKLAVFLHNYFPHLWQDPDRAVGIVQQMMSRRPLEGSAGFLKERSIPTIREGREAGLVPVSSNPVDLTLLKLREINRYLMGQDVVRDLKARGLWKFVKTGMHAPPGYVRLADKAARVWAPPYTTVEEAFDEQLMEGLKQFARENGIRTARKVDIGGKGRWGYAINTALPGVAEALEESGKPEVATKFAGPVSVLVHEIGHAIDNRYGTWKQVLDDPNPGMREEYRRQGRALADLRWEGKQPDNAWKEYVRKAPEKAAVMLEAYIHAPERFQEVAPDLYKRFDEILKSNPKLEPLTRLRRGLVLGTNEADVPLAGPPLIGEYWLPQPVAQVLENYLAPGLRGNAAFDAYRTIGNVLNQAQLGLSAFHIGFVGFDAATSKFALALRQAIHGNGIDALKSFAETPFAPITTLVKGHALLRAYRGGPATDELYALAKHYAEAGGRAGQDEFYRTKMYEQFRQALGEHRIGGAALKALPGVVDAIAKPMFEWYVPRMKAGVWMDLARFELERLGDKATPDDVRMAMQRAYDSVENRMGQMAYDNLNWSKTAKDLAMASTRSVGWNVGTLRELGGGVSDLVRSANAARKGDGFELSNRSAYTLALPVMVGLAGAMLTKLYTGLWPKTAKDYQYPPTGRLNPDGTEERLQIPSYWKDVNAYRTDPWQTVKHKINPALSLALQELENKDYYGNMIRNPDDPWYQRTLQGVKYAGKEAVPFGIQYYLQSRRRGQSPDVAAGNFIGITPAPRTAVRTPAENLMHEYAAREGKTALTPEEAAAQDERYTILRDLREKPGQGVAELRDAYQGGRITRAQAVAMLKRNAKDPLRLQFQQLKTLDQALAVYQLGSPAERGRWWGALVQKVATAQKNGDYEALRKVAAVRPGALPRVAPPDSTH